ncbi:hypothetical protein AVEN_100409-1 [Araneus ventricosus]|uniref:Uncharacterized protein n=1 Tax=Araneus ventricosus TaxID=182803 RepID=A0A4Y2JVV5_ARAVE|nr:hypothetical protein AVEN_100409-1 [Araneus ventricosus]
MKSEESVTGFHASSGAFSRAPRFPAVTPFGKEMDSAISRCPARHLCCPQKALSNISLHAKLIRLPLCAHFQYLGHSRNEANSGVAMVSGARGII